VSRAEIEDLCGDFFISLVSDDRRRLREKNSDWPFGHWLFWQARGFLAHSRRARAAPALRDFDSEREAASALEGSDDPQSLTVRALERAALEERVLRALEGLSPPVRDAFVLYAWDGLTPTEIGAALGISTRCAQKRCERARSRLRAVLRDVPERE
jgi:RNA polymerase sigma factor (sigma-70 family)